MNSLHYVFIQNEGSGSGAPEQLRRQISERMTEADRSFRIMPLPDIDNFLSKLADDDQIVLVAVGGDGTVNQVAKLALARDLPFGIIPAGTFNFVARSNGIPEDFALAMDCLLSGHAKPVQVGAVNGKPFLVNACIGLYAKLLRERETFKQTIGRSRLVATLAAFVTALRPYRALRIRLDDGQSVQSLTAASFFVGNNRLQLELVGIRQGRVVGNGRLLGVLLPRVGAFDLLRLLGAAIARRASEIEALHSFDLDAIRVDIERPRRKTVRVALDGEIHTMTPPLNIGASAQALKLICQSQREPELRQEPALEAV